MKLHITKSYPDLMSLVCGHAKQNLSGIVEALQPRLPRVVRARHRENIPVIRLVPALVALLAAPAVVAFDNLLVAARRLARGVPDVVRLDVHDRRARVEDVHLVRRAQLALLHLVQREHLRAVELHKAAPARVRVRVRLVRLPRTCGIVPPAQRVRLRYVWVHLHYARREHGERAPAEVADACRFNGDHRLVIVDERFGLLAPEREAHGIPGAVYQRQFPFLKLCGTRE